MPQDAIRLNRLQIHAQEQLNRERRAQDEVAERRKAEALKRSKNQYGHVESHGYGLAPGNTPGSSVAVGGDAEIRVYVRECDSANARSYTYTESEGIAEAVANARQGGPSSAPQRLPPVQRVPRQVATTASGSPMARGGPRAAAAVAAPRPNAEAPNKGRVPRYLVQRKAEMAAEKEAMAAAAAEQQERARIPAGHRLVSEEEKAETLASLEARWTELELQLGKLPIRFDTQAIRTRRRNIEEELAQIEAKKTKYSTKKPLYVPLY